MQERLETSIPTSIRYQTIDDFQAMMSTLGYLLLRRGQVDTGEISRIVQGLQTNYADAGSRWTEVLSKNWDQDKESSLEGGHSNEDFNYYENLKKLSTREGIPLQRSVVDEGMGAKVCVKLIFEGKEFFGRGYSLKEALERAAKKAWKAFHLTLT